MKTSGFLSFLRAHAALPLVFRSGRDTLPAGFHLTEVKRVAYETMDCGGAVHRWAETQIELWAPPLLSALPGRTAMAAGKFLGIVEKVARELSPENESEIRFHAALGSLPAALYSIDSVTPTEGRLRIELIPDRVRCKAVERRIGELTGGCCGVGAEPNATEADAKNCGCGSPAETSACCS